MEISAFRLASSFLGLLPSNCIQTQSSKTIVLLAEFMAQAKPIHAFIVNGFWTWSP